jgi:ribosome maturation protein SDO1
MVKLEEAVIARLEHEGKKFEVLVDPDLALELRKGKTVDFNELLATDTVFKDSNKGEVASEEDVNKVFGTTEIERVVDHIIKHGRVQLTTEQRRAMLEKRKKEIIALIARDAWDPQTNAPHPPQRIENALSEAKIQIDELKSAQEQVKDIVDKLKSFIPISMERLKLAVKVPAAFSGKSQAVLHKFNVLKEEWQKDGSLIAVLEVPAGQKMDLLNELNHLTHGEVEVKVLEK